MPSTRLTIRSAEHFGIIRIADATEADLRYSIDQYFGMNHEYPAKFPNGDFVRVVGRTGKVTYKAPTVTPNAPDASKKTTGDHVRAAATAGAATDNGDTMMDVDEAINLRNKGLVNIENVSDAGLATIKGDDPMDIEEMVEPQNSQVAASNVQEVQLNKAIDKYPALTDVQKSWYRLHLEGLEIFNGNRPAWFSKVDWEKPIATKWEDDLRESFAGKIEWTDGMSQVLAAVQTELTEQRGAKNPWVAHSSLYYHLLEMRLYYRQRFPKVPELTFDKRIVAEFPQCFTEQARCEKLAKADKEECDKHNALLGL